MPSAWAASSCKARIASIVSCASRGSISEVCVALSWFVEDGGLEKEDRRFCSVLGAITLATVATEPSTNKEASTFTVKRLRRGVRTLFLTDCSSSRSGSGSGCSFSPRSHATSKAKGAVFAERSCENDSDGGMEFGIIAIRREFVAGLVQPT